MKNNKVNISGSICAGEEAVLLAPSVLERRLYYWLHLCWRGGCIAGSICAGEEAVLLAPSVLERRLYC